MFSHFDLLLGPAPQDPSPHDSQVINAWTSFPQTGSVLDNESISDGEQGWESVLDVYEPIPEGKNLVIDRILTRPDAEQLLDTLPTLLLQPHGQDISGEVAEIIGYDDMDLVLEILESREGVGKQLDDLKKSRAKSTNHSVDYSSLSEEDARRRMEESFRKNAARPLFSGVAEAAPEVLPHIYTSSSMVQGNVLSQFGTRYLLPMGTTRETHDVYEEVVIPPARPVPPRATERLIPVTELDPLAQGSFTGYSALNRIQSIVYPTAYGSNENMLVCAPTGAGKTDVAMLTILRVLDQHRTPSSGSVSIASTINRNSFKIIYVAPMKALASEIVRKFSKRLKWLSIQVKELTGDMQLTKAEIAETQVIVTTPEKWDVVTRKPTGEGELASALRLLIIDEVHLLNEERGAVIETIVARTLRQVETSQSVIRIVGLSATLPNYMDVAEFLSVSRYKGLFYFDSSFRPVPLEQHFIGIKGKAGSSQSKKNLETVTFDKVSELVQQGHQVMVFVHARKETVKSAQALREAALLKGISDDFSCEDHPQWSQFRKSIGESRNREMKELFDHGFGIHHAGMLRSDRNMMERMFEARAIKVLCCTATLAWGVNLPAHAVVIKGTQVYDSAKGAFVDLSVLDVLQVFGRAGRPGLESSGEGYICTTEDKLNHYLEAVTSQNPIESKFRGGMVDSMNAEISLGTVANISDAVKWLGYTYLFVRMRKNPLVYGVVPHDDDPQLALQKTELVEIAAKKLADVKMIEFDRTTHQLKATDLGRIASKYYIRHSSIEIFNKNFRPKMTEADVLAMLSLSTEFEQIQVRESEATELERLEDIIPCDVKGGATTSDGKVNILLQGFISRLPVEDFALVSDMAYAAQNGGRIIRALLEIAISRKWASVSAALMGLSKAIEKRLWPYDQPLKQFDLKGDIFYNLERWADEWSPAELADVSAAELGKLIHLNEGHGKALLNAAKQFPSTRVSYKLRPLGHDVLKIAVTITPTFTWSKVHGNSEPFWLWVEDHEGVNILQLHHLVFRSDTKDIAVDFVISIQDGQKSPALTIRWVSDHWMGAENETLVSLDGIVMPSVSHSHTGRLDLPFLATSVVRNQAVEQSILRGRIHNFNSIQTQAFWTLANTSWNSLLCAPGSSGKSTMMRIVAWLEVSKSPEAWVLVIAPTKSAVVELLSEFRVASLSGVVVASTTSLTRPQGKAIHLITAGDLLRAISQRDPKLPLRGLNLVLCESLEQLNPAYELGISLLRHAVQVCPTRFIGISNSLRDPTDMATWLKVDSPALFSFMPADRDQSLGVSTLTFTVPHSAALFKAMAKPAYTAVAAGESSIVFVPSRAQCQPIAYDLITQCALDRETDKGFLPETVSPERLEDYLARFRDSRLIDVVSRGIGFFHEGIQRSDRNLMLELYAEGIIRVLVVPRDSCWTLPVRAGVVVVMGTQYIHMSAEGGDRQLRDYELEEMVRMQSRAVRHAGSGHFHLFCQAEAKDTFMRFLSDGLPLESSLIGSPELFSWYQSRAHLDKQQIVDALSFTFLAHRIVSNPTYYDCVGSSRDENLSRLVDDLVYSATSSGP